MIVSSKIFFAALALSLVSTISMAQWLTPKTMSVGRNRLVIVRAHNKVYIAGGADASSVTNKIDVYDNATGELTPYSKNLTVGRADMTGVWNENRNKIYFAGGNTSNNKSNVIEILNLATNSFESQWTLPVSIAYMGSASYGDKILFAGGSDGPTWSDKVYVYNTITGGAPEVFQLSEGRDQIAVTMIGSMAIMAGGHKGGGVYSDNVDIFDFATNSMVTGHGYQLSEPRAFSAATSNDSIAFFGGGQRASGNTGSTVVDVLDFTKGPAASTTVALQQARFYLAAASTGSKVFFAGGGAAPNPPGTAVAFANVDIFDVTNRVVSTTPEQTQMSVARTSISGASVGTKVLFAGGLANGGTYSNVVDIYDTERIKPLLNSSSPADGATNVSFETDLVLTFNEKVKKGTGNITVKAGGEVIATIPVSSASVTVSDTQVTITLANFMSESNITIEMAAGVIEDLASNDFDGFVSPNELNFTTETLVTSQTGYIDTFVKDGNTREVKLTVNDYTKILGDVKFRSRGISDDPLTMNNTTPTRNVNEYKVALNNNNFNDAIGLYYFFEFSDLSGRTHTTEPHRTYIEFSTKDLSDAIPSLRYGNTMDKYQIVSIPVELVQKSASTVFSDLGEYDPKKWRLYQYTNGDNKEFSGSLNIEPGVGYWLITLENVTIRPGIGTTVKFDNEGDDVPFTITLKPGFNLIGNPYNFAISWADILDANDGADTKLTSDVGVYNGGQELTNGGIKINPYRGAFAENITNSDVVIKIPVRRNNNIPGRLASEEVDLSSYNWHLPIDLSDGIVTNATGGFGMNKQATLEGRDRFDRLPIPAPNDLGIGRISFAHPEINKSFVREIVPTSDSHVWDFDIKRESDRQLVLTWDPTLIAESEKQLYLVDLSFGVIKDMKSESNYTVPPSTSSLKVIFGSSEFLKKSLDEVLPLTGYPYPNPALDEVRVPFHIPSRSGKLEVRIEVIGSQGTKVATLAEGVYETGSHEVVWNTSGKSGLYLIQTKVGSERPKLSKVVVK